MIAISILCTILSCQMVQAQDNRPWHPPELRSDKELIGQQNALAHDLGLPVITNAVLAQLKKEKKLVCLSSNQYYDVDSIRLGSRWTYPYVRDYIDHISKRYYETFHKRLIIKSLVRTVEQQRRMTTRRIHGRRNRGYNPNAFINPENPDLVSLHSFALAFDVTAKHMTAEEIAWMRTTLSADVTFTNHRVQPAEESSRLTGRPIAYHVVVFDASFLVPYSLYD